MFIEKVNSLFAVEIIIFLSRATLELERRRKGRLSSELVSRSDRTGLVYLAVSGHRNGSIITRRGLCLALELLPRTAQTPRRRSFVHSLEVEVVRLQGESFLVCFVPGSRFMGMAIAFLGSQSLIVHSQAGEKGVRDRNPSKQIAEIRNWELPIRFHPSWPLIP